MTTGSKIQKGDWKADLLRVSKDGRRFQVEYVCPVSGKLKRDWVWADGWSKR